MLRKSDNPHPRHPLGRPLEADADLWVVAHLKSRQEKAFAGDLMRMDVPYYLPMVEKRVRRRDNNKLRKTLLPLFPGYVSVALPPEEWDTLYQTNRVATLIPIPDQEAFLMELLQVQRVLDSGSDLEVAPAFESGEKVCVRNGPLRGLRGMVLEYCGKSLFQISVTLFQQSIRVAIQDDYLERVIDAGHAPVTGDGGK